MTVQIVISLSWLVSFDQCHIINWRKLKKLIGKCFPKQNIEPQKPQNLKKILRKSQVSNAWATIFKNNDFSESSLKVKNGYILAFFLILNSFLPSLLMVVPSSSVNLERLKHRNVALCGLFVVGKTCQQRCPKMTFVVSVKPN